MTRDRILESLFDDKVLLIIFMGTFQVIENLEEQFVENNITLITSEVFNYDPTSQIENLKVTLI